MPDGSAAPQCQPTKARPDDQVAIPGHPGPPPVIVQRQDVWLFEHWGDRRPRRIRRPRSTHRFPGRRRRRGRSSAPPRAPATSRAPGPAGLNLAAAFGSPARPSRTPPETNADKKPRDAEVHAPARAEEAHQRLKRMPPRFRGKSAVASRENMRLASLGSAAVTAPRGRTTLSRARRRGTAGGTPATRRSKRPPATFTWTAPRCFTSSAPSWTGARTISPPASCSTTRTQKAPAGAGRASPY